MRGPIRVIAWQTVQHAALRTNRSQSAGLWAKLSSRNILPEGTP